MHYQATMHNIEYYSRFLWIILVFGVNYQCVTLPFAMVWKPDHSTCMP